MAKILNFQINLVLLITIITPTIWAIYVPEHTSSQLYIMDTLEMKPKEYNNQKHTIYNDDNNKLMQPEQQQQSVNKYQLKINDGQQTLAHALQAKNIPTRMLQRHDTSYDTNDDVVNAFNNGNNNNNNENLEAQPTSFKEQQQSVNIVDDDDDDDDNVVVGVFDKISKMNNDDSDVASNAHLHSRQRRQLSDFLIAPNTRWCGRGNTANNTYNHLGGASMADKCCRTHDHCKAYISAMSNRFELFNYRPYTLSHCNCDRRFRTCLKMANDEDANTIGKLFFNLVQTQCFILVKENICLERATDGTCAKKHTKQKAYLRNNKKF